MVLATTYFYSLRPHLHEAVWDLGSYEWNFWQIIKLHYFHDTSVYIEYIKKCCNIHRTTINRAIISLPIPLLLRWCANLDSCTSTHRVVRPSLIFVVLLSTVVVMSNNYKNMTIMARVWKSCPIVVYEPRSIRTIISRQLYNRPSCSTSVGMERRTQTTRSSTDLISLWRVTMSQFCRWGESADNLYLTSCNLSAHAGN